MSDGPVFVERIDYEAALSWYMENDDGTEDALVNAINVALVGVREAKEGQELTFFGPLIVPARYDPAYDVALPAGRYFVIRLDGEVKDDR